MFLPGASGYILLRWLLYTYHINPYYTCILLFHAHCLAESPARSYICVLAICLASMTKTIELQLLYMMAFQCANVDIGTVYSSQLIYGAHNKMSLYTHIIYCICKSQHFHTLVFSKYLLTGSISSKFIGYLESHFAHLATTDRPLTTMVELFDLNDAFTCNS